MRAIAALVLANLPVRYWDRFEEHFPVARVAWVSGVLTMAAGFAVGIPGYLAFVAEAASGFNQAVMRISPDHMGAKGWALAALMSFFFGSWIGVLTLYLSISGLLRFASAYMVDDPRGDFLLSGIDAGLRKVWRRTRAYDARRAREKREGVEMPDRLVTGARLGRPDLEWVILASRAKWDWEPNSYLVTDEGVAYRIGQSFDVVLTAGLRTAYPLTELRTGEAIRYAIPYELPLPWKAPIQ